MFFSPLIDPPRFNTDELAEFAKLVEIKTGKDVVFKLSFVGREPIKVQWYHEGEELLDDTNIKIEKSGTHTRLVLAKCKRKTSGEIKVKIKNECGTMEAISQLVVLGLYATCYESIQNVCKSIQSMDERHSFTGLSYYR